MTRSAWLALALITGCGSTPVPSRSTPGVFTVAIDTTANPRPAALPAHSLWYGAYQCPQGLTGLTLTLDVGAGGRTSAVFDFGAVPQNPSVPTGRYLLVGVTEVAPDGRASWVRLTPDRWIMQPPGYVMVGLTGQIDPSARMMRGVIDNPSCGALELSRAQ